MARVRVVRKGVTAAELATVLSRRLGVGFEVLADGQGEVLVRRSLFSAAIVRIGDVPGATVFRVRGVGMLTSFWTAHIVADALRRSPEFRSV